MQADLLTLGRQVLANQAFSAMTQAVCRCDIFLELGGERKLCAAAQGTIRKAE